MLVELVVQVGGLDFVTLVQGQLALLQQAMICLEFQVTQLVKMEMLAQQVPMVVVVVGQGQLLPVLCLGMG
jgi:hypothetical protein